MIDTSTMNDIISLAFTTLNDISKQSAGADGLLSFRGQSSWHVWQLPGTDPSTAKEPRMARWHCPRLGGARFYAVWWAARTLSSLAVQKAAWHSQVTAGIGGHTCRHTVNLPSFLDTAGMTMVTATRVAYLPMLCRETCLRGMLVCLNLFLLLVRSWISYSTSISEIC